MMKPKRSDVVSASEIASWAWCPESWRLSALGAEPENQAALARGRRFHTRTSAVEVWSRRAARLACWLLVVAVLLVALWYALTRGGG
jgi:hypothetical protein